MVLSIHPQFADAIMEGTKRVELRKTPFPRNAEAVLMYATSPARYIVGGFVIETVAVDTPKNIYLMTAGRTGITTDDFMAYYEGKKYASALIIRRSFMFTNKIEPDKYIKNWTPPQNYRYITWKEHDEIMDAGLKPAGGSMPSTRGAGTGRGSDSPPPPPAPLCGRPTDGPPCRYCSRPVCHVYDDYYGCDCQGSHGKPNSFWIYLDKWYDITDGHDSLPPKWRNVIYGEDDDDA